MIVKIWPIKADYGGERGKVGGLEGLENSVKYIMDKEKIIATEEEEKAYKGFDESDVLEGSRINRDFDINRVVSYMANKDKTEIKYASTYLCPESNPAIDFRNSANLLAVKSGFKIDPDTGAMAFHLVQSFPEHLNISDEEVHQCGMDLVQRLGKYQALICSHVHPVLDEKNEVHGKCKHNHILLNAYMHPDFYDYTAPDVGKYNDCVESYRQLQIYNDEIAIEHGLPIIRWPISWSRIVTATLSLPAMPRASL